ncbi:glycoside hydrolase family 3 C-terminal domain-containing protein [Streptomyces showdoensis]|uniref:Glycosyl hydrolase family 3 n=1 Tax=Streptomyces showdoensis TaxID=68268 RepID=A0A2P2GED5_STREW|nr:glycoside hydrolase family 3 C-terminal domain-containing protein [Streptomyces showdoensis]KKZ69888.1 glycosyl hydrolase family 3 [Streptomyces showdoensis]
MPHAPRREQDETDPTPAPRSLSRRRLLLSLAGAAALSAVTAGTAHALAAPPPPGGRTGRPVPARPSERVRTLVERLTLDEKTALLHGATDPAALGQAGYVPGVPRLGIPPLRLADGPAGVRVARRATALPAPVMLAAAFDPALARAYGQVIGHEGRALGQDVLLSPMVNLIRTPYAGRNFETFSEDPLLSADLVAEEIRGIQAEGLVATVKHLALNNQERDRMSVDVRAAEQTLHETELRGFEAAVAAGAGSVMAAYNKVDGVHATESSTLLTEILRELWGFDGWVMSDWGAVHSTAAALTAGCDMEMPGGAYYGAALSRAVDEGRVGQDVVDTAVARILAVRERFGLLDEDAARPTRDAAAGARLALRVATAGATLLRNEAGALPLTGPAARSIAVIGPTGAVPFVSGGGSAHVVPDAADSPLDALRARAGDRATVTYALGEDISGKPLPATVPARDLDAVGLAAGETWSYEGTLTTTADDDWSFFVHYGGQRPVVTLDGAELFPVKAGVAEFFAGGLGGRAADGLSLRRADRRLAAGAHTLTVTARGGAKGQLFRLRATSGATRAADVAEAVSAARAAHSVVLFAYEDASEGRDRTGLALPGRQEDLITAVTAVNPRTTVVLNTSSAVTMPWLADTAAVLQMYYPGQEGAAATAAVLFGDADPGGRLTQTFPAAEDRHPTAGDPVSYPGKDGIEEYREGVHVGHRWYDAHDVTPLFPFGHGLSYTRFGYADLRVVPFGEGLDVGFTVINTGTRTGVEVAQVYVGPSPDLASLGVDQPHRLLAGYRRLELAPGERRRVTVRVADRTLSSWDPARRDWVLGTGRRELRVGSSSRTFRLWTETRVGTR